MSNTEGRSDVTFSRWTRYGKDRVYVSYGSKGHPAGYIDVAGETPEYICESRYRLRQQIISRLQILTTTRR